MLRRAYNELSDRVQINEQENVSALNESYAAYEIALDQAYQNATRTVDPNSGLESYENLVLPSFNYQPVSVFDQNNLNGKVSKSTQIVFDALVDEDISNDQLLFDRLEKEMANLEQLVAAGEINTKKNALINGNMVNLSGNTAPAYTYSVSAIPNPANPEKLMLSIALATGKANLRLSESRIDVTFEGSVKGDTVELREASTSEGSLILTFDGEDITVSGGTDILSVRGSITLDNDEVLDINADATLNVKSNGEAINQRLAAQDIKIKHNGIQRIGVADFRRVDQQVCCYVPGEVSRIENILAKEYKERSTRQLLSTETTIETIEESEVENLTDTTTAERNELASEVTSIINQDQSSNYGASAGVSGSFGLGGNKTNFYADAFYNGASSSSSSNSNSTSQFYAEEVTQRALERVVQKVTKRRSSRIVREFEENNKHGFDNREGTSHVTGVYRWVDKVYNNQLINYGKRLMYEFNVPEPSRYFKEAIIETIEGQNPQQISGIPGGLLAPEEPVAMNFDAEDLFRWNYQTLAARYKAQVSAPPKDWLRVSGSFSGKDINHTGGDDGKIQTVTGNGEIEIPDGYAVKSVNYSFVTYPHGFNGTPKGYITVAGRRSLLENNGNGRSGSFGGMNITEKLAYSFTAGESPIISGTIDANCQLSNEAFQQWRNETYDAIAAAYQERVNEYNDWLYANFEPALPEVEDSTRKAEFNPLLNRALEKRELKRLAVDMLARPFGITTGRDHYHGSITHPHLTATLSQHAEYVKFFEQAFEWEIMAYTFYPYFYANRWRWDSLLLESNGTDPIFQAFLQSGMARMVVAVRPGFEKTVTYFMETGDVMMGDALAVDRDDDLYLSIAEEMEQTDGKVEKEWETRVPTALTIVQSDSGPYTENGLPCCDLGPQETGLGHGSSIMVGRPDSGV